MDEQRHNYFTALENILKNSGKYADILALNPENFGLPETWDSPIIDREINKPIPESKNDLIQDVLFFYIEEKFRNSEKPISLDSIAKKLDAPLQVIVNAARYLD